MGWLKKRRRASCSALKWRCGYDACAVPSTTLQSRPQAQTSTRERVTGTAGFPQQSHRDHTELHFDSVGRDAEQGKEWRHFVVKVCSCGRFWRRLKSPRSFHMCLENKLPLVWEPSVCSGPAAAATGCSAPRVSTLQTRKVRAGDAGETANMRETAAEWPPCARVRRSRGCCCCRSVIAGWLCPTCVVVRC